MCTTRRQTGVGYPQLSAVIECADAAHGLGGHIIADGGCKVPGDVAKAFGGGADFVMMGGYFAGHTESGGELIERDGRQYKLFYGPSCRRAGCSLMCLSLSVSLCLCLCLCLYLCRCLCLCVQC